MNNRNNHIQYQLNESWHVAEALRHEDKFLSNSGDRSPMHQIIMVCKTAAFFRIYLATVNSPCKLVSEKPQRVQVVRFDERQHGTNSGSSQFSIEYSSEPLGNFC